MEQENLNKQNKPAAMEEINLLELAGRLWNRRKFILLAGIIGAAVGLVIAYSIPKEYMVTVTLARESGKSLTNGLSSTVSMLGVGGASGDGDALSVVMFPEILASNPFALELYDMDVTTGKGESMPLNKYMGTQREAWWKWLMRQPAKLFRGLFHKKTSTTEAPLDPFRLTRKETSRLNAIKNSMSAVVDRKTAKTTVTVTLQDPLVAASVADSVVHKLQDYITAYRTQKAVEDCDYLERLYGDCQKEYYEAQQRYAEYVDGNRNLSSRRSMVEGDRLQNDMNQAFQLYSQVASQLQVARAKVQEAKPVFAVLNPATVPVKEVAPKKKLILLAFIFLACAGAAAWVLFGEGMWNSIRELSVKK